MKGFFRFVGLVVFLGIAWVAIPMLVGRDKESEQRLVGALNFVQDAIKYSHPAPFDLDVFDSPSIERESEPNVWSISATLAITDGTGTVIHEPYTAVVENVCQAYAERECWRLIQLTIGDIVLGNQTGSLRAALERIAHSVTLDTRTTSLDTEKTGAQPSKARTSEAPTAGMLLATETARILASKAPAIDPAADATPGATETAVTPDSKVTANSAATETPHEANEPATTQLSRAPAADISGDITAQSTDGARTQTDRSLVLMIQRQLRDRGLDVGPLDGVMGPRTRVAIATFQQRHDLTSDGIPSRSLLNSLRSKPRGQNKIGTGARPLLVKAPTVTPSGRDQGSVTDTQVALGAANAGFKVELSAYGTAEVTMRERERLQEALSDLLGETNLTVERINLGERGIQYQVQANQFPERLSANYICARIRARKSYCQVFTANSLARAISTAKTTNTAFTGGSGNLPPSMQEDGSSYARAGVQAQNRGIFGKAIEFYSLAIESGDLSRRDLARVYNNRGAAYKNMEFYDLAIDDYNTAIRLKKEYARAYYNRAIAFGSMGLLDDAIKDYSTALQLKPGDASAYNNRGLAYNRAGLHRKAIADYSQAIRLAPSLSYAYYNRGLAYEMTDERRRAIADFKKSYALNPNSRIYQAKIKDIGSILY